MFHDKQPGETPGGRRAAFHDEQPGETSGAAAPLAPPGLDAGILLGILIGAGHFGGDGRQPQITIKMHVRHRRLFDWLVRACPGSRLYGPYSYEGRNFYQWMVRGTTLRATVAPILDQLPLEEIDEHTHARYAEMKRRYGF
jgi:hypothetical protein